MHDHPSRRECLEGGLGRVHLAGAAHLELVDGVVQLRPEDAMVEAMLRGWRAQQTARGLREETMFGREQLVRRFLEFTNCLLYTSPSPRDRTRSRMPSSA